MHLEYQRLLDEIPELAERSSGSRARSSADASGRRRALAGVVLLLRAPGARQGDRTSSPRRPARPAGTSTTLERDAILEEPAEIVETIRSTPDTPRDVHDREADPARRCATQVAEAHQEHLPEARRAPVGVKPALRCWMELNDG